MVIEVIVRRDWQNLNYTCHSRHCWLVSNDRRLSAMLIFSLIVLIGFAFLVVTGRTADSRDESFTLRPVRHPVPPDQRR
jgi:hypothetical protein